jgi:hypothetical protein
MPQEVWRAQASGFVQMCDIHDAHESRIHGQILVVHMEQHNSHPLCKAIKHLRKTVRLWLRLDTLVLSQWTQTQSHFVLAARFMGGMAPFLIPRTSASSPEHDHVRESVVRTGTATVRTGIDGLYLATSRAVDPPRVRTTMRLAWTYEWNGAEVLATDHNKT